MNFWRNVFLRNLVAARMGALGIHVFWSCSLKHRRSCWWILPKISDREEWNILTVTLGVYTTFGSVSLLFLCHKSLYSIDHWIILLARNIVSFAEGVWLSDDSYIGWICNIFLLKLLAKRNFRIPQIRVYRGDSFLQSGAFFKQAFDFEFSSRSLQIRSPEVCI